MIRRHVHHATVALLGPWLLAACGAFPTRERPVEGCYMLAWSEPDALGAPRPERVRLLAPFPPTADEQRLRGPADALDDYAAIAVHGGMWERRGDSLRLGFGVFGPYHQLSLDYTNASVLTGTARTFSSDALTGLEPTYRVTATRQPCPAPAKHVTS